MKRGFGQNCFAGQQRFGDSLGDLQGPSVMDISPVPECYQEASVRNGLHFREKPLRVERSAGPFTAPARRKNGFLDDFRALSSSILTMRLRGTPALRAAWSSHSASSSGSRTVSVLLIFRNCNTATGGAALSSSIMRRVKTVRAKPGKLII